MQLQFIIRIVLLATSLLCAGLPLPAQERSDIVTIVDSVGIQAIEKDGVVGMSIGVALGEDVSYSQGYGLANAELKVPASAETVYRIGSISKEFTAAAILLLQEDGALDLDDPLTKFLPDYPQSKPPVTLKHLLQHTSGIPDLTRLPSFPKDRAIDATLAEAVERFQDLPLEFTPGEKFRYCNSGFILLALVVEKASGQSFEDFLQERVLAPLKLKKTYCDEHSLVIPQRASGYTNWRGNLRNAPYISLRQTTGAGSMASTVGELLAWQPVIVSEQLLSRKSFQLMTTRGKLTSGKEIEYGLGVFVQKKEGQLAIRHAGGISGFRSEVVHYPDSKLTIAILANTGSANTTRYANQIAKEILAEK